MFLLKTRSSTIQGKKDSFAIKIEKDFDHRQTT